MSVGSSMKSRQRKRSMVVRTKPSAKKKRERKQRLIGM